MRYSYSSFMLSGVVNAFVLLSNNNNNNVSLAFSISPISRVINNNALKNDLPSSSSLQMIFGSPSMKVDIPNSIDTRDKQALTGIRAALDAKSSSLIECEFPALGSLNQLGDGSMRSAKRVEEANLNFAGKLMKELTPALPFMSGYKCCLVTSSATSKSFVKAANAKAKSCGCTFASLKENQRELLENAGTSNNMVYLFLNPSISSDYFTAQQLSQTGATSVIINGFAKDQKSVPGTAIMAYFLKPLTYNSQIAGYLIRKYPGKWATIDATSKEVLALVEDSEILVPKTNTPDLRASGRLVQKSVDDRAIEARKRGL